MSMLCRSGAAHLLGSMHASLHNAARCQHTWAQTSSFLRHQGRCVAPTLRACSAVSHELLIHHFKAALQSVHVHVLLAGTQMPCSIA